MVVYKIKTFWGINHTENNYDLEMLTFRPSGPTRQSNRYSLIQTMFEEYVLDDNS